MQHIAAHCNTLQNTEFKCCLRITMKDALETLAPSAQTPTVVGFLESRPHRLTKFLKRQRNSIFFMIQWAACWLSRIWECGICCSPWESTVSINSQKSALYACPIRMPYTHIVDVAVSSLLRYVIIGISLLRYIIIRRCDLWRIERHRMN